MVWYKLHEDRWIMIYKIIKLTQCYLKWYRILDYAIILTWFYSDEVPEIYFIKRLKRKVLSGEGTCKIRGKLRKGRGHNPIIQHSDTTRMEYSFGFIFVGFLLVTGSASPIEHDYCVIGAGPAGLQIGYFLHKAHRNYVILEKSLSAGRIILI